MQLSERQKWLLYCIDIVCVMDEKGILESEGKPVTITAKGRALVDQFRQEGLDIPDREILAILRSLDNFDMDDIPLIASMIRRSLDIGYYPFIEELENLSAYADLLEGCEEPSEGPESTE